jgi:hypothetical protein
MLALARRAYADGGGCSYGIVTSTANVAERLLPFSVTVIATLIFRTQN